MTSIKKNFIYNSLFQIVNIVVPLITTPYLARVLRPEGVGIYSFAYTVAYYFVTISMLGLYNYGNRSIAKVRDDREKCGAVFCEIYCMQIVTTLLLLMVYILYLLFVVNDKMAWMLIPYVISPIFDVNWYFFGIEKFKLTATRNIIIKILTTALIFTFVKSQTDLYTYGFIMGMSFLITQVSVWPALIKEVSFKRPNIQNIIKHIKPNLVLFIPVIAITLYKMMDKIMLGMIINKNQVGFYESSEKIIQIPLALITALGTVMLPRMSNLAANRENEKGISYIKSSLIIAALISSSTCFGIMGVSKEFVPLFYGEGYETCITLFLILMPSCVVMAFANVVRTQYLVPQELDKIYITSVSIGAVINLTLNALLIPHLESAGAAIGTLCAEFFVAVYQMFAIRNRIKIFAFLPYTIPFILSGLVMFGILYFLPIGNGGFTGFVLKIVIGMFLYILCAGISVLLLKYKYMRFLDIDMHIFRRKN